MLPRVILELISGDLSMCIDDDKENWGLFVYRDYEINPDDKLDGLLQSKVLLQVSRSDNSFVCTDIYNRLGCIYILWTKWLGTPRA